MRGKNEGERKGGREGEGGGKENEEGVRKSEWKRGRLRMRNRR